MRPKRRRLYFVLAGMAALGIAVALVLAAFEDNLVFFSSPTDVYARDLPSDRKFRLGGLVEEQSVKKSNDGLTTTFRITDLTSAVPVAYTGILPDLFREGQGVVTEGHLGPDGVFIAESVLAKHDENYMPPEVAEALKKSGQWKGAAQ
ncbi:MAG: cytochrome c maturation protein CcmE [Proteobacteria bacterium]|nr:cytochrome c maturation protein CcmE [Pseudomonadota bacterium]